MKTYIKLGMVLFAIVCFPLLSSAQIDFKVNVGPHFNNVKTNTAFNYITKKWFTAGGIDGRIVFRSEEKLQLETGVGYNIRGISTIIDQGAISNQILDDIDDFFGGNPDLTPDDHDLLDAISELIDYPDVVSKSVLHHIEIPFQVNFYPMEASKGIFLSGTVRPSLLFGASTVTYEKGNKNSKQKLKIRDATPVLYLFGRAGIGYEIPIGNLGLAFSTYFEYQLISTKEQSQGFSANHYGLGAIVGLRF